MTGTQRGTALFRVALGSILTVVFSVTSAFGFACIRTDGGQCIHWAQHAATLKSFLGGSFDPSAVGAAGDWNGVGADFHFDAQVGGQFFDPCGAPGPNHVCTNTGPIGDNPLLLSSTFCGQGFGDIIELTNDCWNGSNGEIFNAPVFVNNSVQLSVYDGPIRFANGEVVYDIRRVLLHEFGHVLGLDHPDEHGQNVMAIMNSRVSDLDRLQADDINGIFSLYSGGPPVSNSAPPQPSSGCQINARPELPTAETLVPLLCVGVLVLRRRVPSRASAPRH